MTRQGKATAPGDGGRSDAAPGAVVEPTPPAAGALFGPRLELAEQYAGLLATTGVTHGLIGPREVPRLWDRHVLNCAVLGDAIDDGERVIDVGSGAGLPGLVLAIARPDLELHLVEPMQRRCAWLGEAVQELDLTNVTVHRGRAESVAGVLSAGVVTARAVARLDQLGRWCAPLLEPDGVLLAMKGSAAHEELAADEPDLAEVGFVGGEVIELGADVVTPPTLVVRLWVSSRHTSTRPVADPARDRRNRPAKSRTHRTGLR